MNIELKVKLQRAIDSVLDNNVDENYWDNWIHPDLTKQMTNAAELIFDSAQDAQKFKDEVE